MDVTAEDATVSTMQNPIFITVDAATSSDPSPPSPPVVAESSAQDQPSEAEKATGVDIVTAVEDPDAPAEDHAEAITIPAEGDNQQPTDATALQEEAAGPMSPSSNHRRTSHRTLKRLQDEQLAASKFAKEKDVSYRLMGFFGSESEELLPMQFESPTRAVLSGDKSSLEITCEGSPTERLVLTREQPTSSNIKIEHETTQKPDLPFDPASFVATRASGIDTNRGIQDVMISYIEECAERVDVTLGDNLVRVLLWMDKCIHQNLGVPVPLTNFHDKLSARARLFLVELEVDAVLSEHDPMSHSQTDFDDALRRSQGFLNLLQLRDDAESLKPRILWLQLHVNEHGGDLGRTATLLSELKAILRQDVHLGNVKTFPHLSHTAIDAKTHTFQSASLVLEARALFRAGGDSDQKVVDLVLPNYDPSTGHAGHINDLITDVCVYLRNNPTKARDMDKTGEGQHNLPLLPMLGTCLRRLDRFDKCFELLVVGFYFALQRTSGQRPANSTMQCLKYIVTQLKPVFDSPAPKSRLFCRLLEYCCFAYRDLVLAHHKSAKMLHRLAHFLTPQHRIRLVGSVLQTFHSMEWRVKPNEASVAIVLGALQQLNRAVAAPTLPANAMSPSLARALCVPIAHYLKQQADVTKYTRQLRRLLYTACTAFALVWYHVHKGRELPCEGLVGLLHDLMTSGDGLHGRGVCSLETNPHSFLEVTKLMLHEAYEYVDNELAQCYACLHGYSLLPSCVNHHGDDVRAKTTSSDTIMELLAFCQFTDKKLVRKESAALFASVLELPDTKATLQRLIPVNEFQSALRAYLNPIASADIHVIKPILMDNTVPPQDESEPLRELWFDLATNFVLPKVKRRGRDYAQLVQYEVQCLKYVTYLRNDIYLHCHRAESYRMIATCLNALRAMIVDHWAVAWRNFTYPKVEPCVDLTPDTAASFETVTSNPFFSQLMEWIAFVQQAADDETSQREVMYKSREMSLLYTRYVAVLGELVLRCCDMAAMLDPTVAHACYEDAAIMVWKMVSESPPDVAETLVSLAGGYISFGLLHPAPEITAEFGFRLNFMMAKVAKKEIKKRPNCIEQWKEVLNFFSTAEMYRQNSDLESLPHAFYQLHASRLKILLEPVSKTGAIQSREDLKPSVDALALVNEYFYVKKTPSKAKSDEAATAGSECTQEEIAKMLADESTHWTARQYLVWNCLEALERVPLDDRYFHPAYYMFAWGLRFSQPLLDRTNEYWTERCTLQSAVKAMKPLFDRKRQQVVAIWLSESETNKLEELHQQQAKYDRLRLKYFSFYLQTMTAAGDSQRVSDLTSWVLASKEDHWAIDAMLLEALSASSSLARVKVLDLFMKCLFAAQDDATLESKVLSHLNRMYTIYLEYNEAWHRVRTSHEQTMGSWIWEVAMSYALYAVVHNLAIKWCDDTVLYVERSLMQYSQSRAINSDQVATDLYQDLRMEEQPFWAALVDDALTFCSTKWPEKAKTKAKPHVPRSKLRFLSSTS